nr:hypothetical protein CFP56_63498 [Quercus suber]
MILAYFSPLFSILLPLYSSALHFHSPGDLGILGHTRGSAVILPSLNTPAFSNLRGNSVPGSPLEARSRQGLLPSPSEFDDLMMADEATQSLTVGPGDDRPGTTDDSTAENDRRPEQGLEPALVDPDEFELSEEDAMRETEETGATKAPQPAAIVEKVSHGDERRGLDRAQAAGE